MLVVDRRFFPHLHPESRGIELMEINPDLIGTRPQLSTPSILDSSETSKGISPISLGHLPPTYEEIFPDFPPSYSELSLVTNTFKTPKLEHFRTSSLSNLRENVSTDMNVNVIKNDDEINNEVNANINCNDTNNESQSVNNNLEQTNINI